MYTLFVFDFCLLCFCRRDVKCACDSPFDNNNNFMLVQIIISKQYTESLFKTFTLDPDMTIMMIAMFRVKVMVCVCT